MAAYKYKLQETLKDILNMPYYRNVHAQSGRTKKGHELAVEKVLILHGFTKYVKKVSAKECELSQPQLFSLFAHMPDCSYIAQPTGSQKPPDFLIKFNGVIYRLECKSNKTIHSVWNDNRPGNDCIYIISSEKHNATTMFLGQDFIDPGHKDIAIFNQLRKKWKNDIIWANKQLTNDRGLELHIRPQYCQRGKAIKVDCFIRPDRAKCENNCLDFVL